MLQGEAGQEQTGLAVFMPQAVSVTQTLQVQSHFYGPSLLHCKRAKMMADQRLSVSNPKAFMSYKTMAR